MRMRMRMRGSWEPLVLLYGLEFQKDIDSVKAEK